MFDYAYSFEEHATTLQTQTGTKDRTAQHIITELIKRGRELKIRLKKPGQPIPDDKLMTEQAAWLKKQPAKPFNVLLQMHGTHN